MPIPNIAERLAFVGDEPEAINADELQEKLARDVEARTKGRDTQPDDDPRRQREYTFHFKFQSGARVYEGRFKNRILNVGQRMQVGALASDLLGGRSIQVVSGMARDLALAIAHLTHSLDKKLRPDWAKDLMAIDDDEVILALYGEVWDHQTTFLGRTHEPKDPPKAAGA